jgi:hypothetical protein
MDDWRDIQKTPVSFSILGMHALIRKVMATQVKESLGLLDWGQNLLD